MSKCHNILSTRTSFFISNAGKVEIVQELKMKFFEQLFYCGWQLYKRYRYSHIIVLNERDILHFCDNIHSSEHHPMKVTYDCLNSIAQMKQA